MRTVEPETSPLGPKKTILVIATVIGCIAILWPKVFHPMLAGSNSGPSSDPMLPPGLLKERGPGCCGVVLNSDRYMNNTLDVGDVKRFRDSFQILVKDQSIRQERPMHMRPDPTMHPAMRERGYPSGPTHTKTVIEGRPGPIPGMRPPMGGGGFQQAPQKGSNSMGLIMPLYTVGIIAFFVYTIMKIAFKKPTPVPEPTFNKDILKNAQAQKAAEEVKLKAPEVKEIKRPGNGPSSKLECRSAEPEKSFQRMTVVGHKAALNSSPGGHEEVVNRTTPVDDNNHLDIEELKRKLEETESAMTKIIARMSQIVPKATTQEGILEPVISHIRLTSGIDSRNLSNQVVTAIQGLIDAADEQLKKRTVDDEDQTPKENPAETTTTEEKVAEESKDEQQTVKILGMEQTSTYEGGKKWNPANRPVPAPKSNPEDLIETVAPQAIYLEGTLPHESQILVSDSEERLEEEPSEEEGEGPAIILSSKMTLSLISLDKDKSSSNGKKKISRDLMAKGSATDLVETIGASDTLSKGL